MTGTTELERLVAQAVVLGGGDHPCNVLGHRWEHVGGRNAGCGYRDCSCSVPVHRCSACGDYDYGDNPEAREIMAECETKSVESEEDTSPTRPEDSNGTS